MMMMMICTSKFEENCFLLKTGYVYRQISELIFTPNVFLFLKSNVVMLDVVNSVQNIVIGNSE